MGQGSSELKNSLAKIPTLKSRPNELKLELTQLVSLVSLDTPLPVKVDQKVFLILLQLLQAEMKISDSLDVHMIFQAIQRLFKTRVFYLEAARNDLKVLVDGLNSTNQTIVLSSLNCISWLLDCRVTVEPGKEKEFNREQAESASKFAFFEYKGYDALCNLLIKYGKSEYVGIISKVLDILSLDLVDHIQTTRFHILQRIVQKLTPHINMLLDLSIHSQVSIRAFTAIVLSGLLLHAPVSFVSTIQEKVLHDAYILYYIMFAVDARGMNENNYYVRKLYHKNLTPLARNLLGLLCSGSEANKTTVLSCIPTPLQGQLEDPLSAEGAQKSKIATKKGDEKDAVTQTLWHAFQTNKVVRVNVDPLFSNLDDEYKLPHIVWTSRMKAELVDQLWAEINSYKLSTQVQPNVSWNYEAFEVTSKYLEKYCRVGNFYVSILIPVLQDRNSAYPLKPELMHQLLSALFQRAVTEDDPSWKLGCLYAISALYERYPEHFKELLIIPYFIYLLDPIRSEAIWRDHILRFLQVVLHEPVNAKRFVLFGGVAHLITYINRIHSRQNPQPLATPLEPLEYLEPPPLARPPTFFLTSPKSEQKQQVQSSEEEESEEEGNGDEEDEGEETEQVEQKKSPVPAPSVAPLTPGPSQSSIPSSAIPKAGPLISPTPAFEIPHGSPSAAKGKKNAVQEGPVPTLKVYKREKTPEEIVWENSDEKENLSGVLPPELTFEEVTARAIRLLRIIAQGGPKLRRSIGNLSVASCLARMMLCPVLEIREDALKLLIDLLHINLNLIPLLYPTGFFTFLVYAMKHSFSDQIVQLIDLTHTKQAEQYCVKGQSILAQFFPQSLIRVLLEEGGTGLREAIENDVNRPDMIWNQSMREELFAAVEEQVEQYKQDLLSDFNKPWVYPTPALGADGKPSSSSKLQFSTLSNELCIGGVYLRPLIEISLVDIQQVSIKSPSTFMTELMKATNSRKYSGEDLISILLASAIAISRYGDLADCQRYKAFPALLALLDQDDPSAAAAIAKQPAELKFPLMQKSAQVLNALLILEGENSRICFENKGLDAIGRALKQLADCDLSDDTIYSCLIHVLACLMLLTRKEPSALRHCESDPQLVKAILSLTTAKSAASFPTIAISANHVLASFSKSIRLQELIARQGGVLELINTALFADHSSQSEEEEDASNSVQQLRNSAINVLAVLTERGDKKMRSVLKTLLGEQLVTDLPRPDQFLNNSKNGSKMTEQHRAALAKYCTEQLQAFEIENAEWQHWNDDLVQLEVQ